MLPEPVLNPEAPRQATLKEPVRLTGVGLHTGKPVAMALLPAPAGHGVKFVRTDLPGRPQVAVHYKALHGGVRGTNVGAGEATVHTIEHFLATCLGLGVDNVLVELDGPEPPALDGSAGPLVDAVLRAGIESQGAARRLFKVARPFSVGEGPERITAAPSRDFRVSYCMRYDSPLIGCQVLDVAVSRETFERDVARARTFCLREEVEELRRAGLAQGGSLDNALVVDGDKLLNEGSLRFPDEFVRHKILDLIGDLGSLGGSIEGHFVALRTGHRHNIALIQQIMESGAMVEMEGAQSAYGVEEIKKLLPHRYPFLLIDRITENKPGVSARGIKNVTVNEQFFEGHFPQRPVMPGVLICEAMAQVAGVCILSLPEHRGKVPFFIGLDGVLFRRPIVPGDQMVIDITVDRLRGNIGKVFGKARVQDKVAAEGTLKFMVLDA